MDAAKLKLIDRIEGFAGRANYLPQCSQQRKNLENQMKKLLLQLDQAKNKKKKGNLKIT